MFQILNWDFHDTVGAKASISFYFAGVKDHGDATKRSEYNLVQVIKFLLQGCVNGVIIYFLTFQTNWIFIQSNNFQSLFSVIFMDN